MPRNLGVYFPPEKWHLACKVLLPEKSAEKDTRFQLSPSFLLLLATGTIGSFLNMRRSFVSEAAARRRWKQPSGAFGARI